MISAFIIGLAGSLHCVGMCGPLMISLKSNQSRRSFFVYHLGRLMVYSVLGLAFGIIGQGLALIQLQKAMALLTGSLIILLYAFPVTRKWMERKYYESRFFSRIRKQLNKHFSSGKKWFVAGVLNGLIPCGLIYLALAGSLVLASPSLSMIFMFLFGLGTLPALVLVSFFENLIPASFRNQLSFVYSTLAIIAGSILIFRGLTAYPTIDEFMQLGMTRIITICGF